MFWILISCPRRTCISGRSGHILTVRKSLHLKALIHHHDRFIELFLLEVALLALAALGHAEAPYNIVDYARKK